MTAHFAAHLHKVQARNEDFHRIDTGLLPLMCPGTCCAVHPMSDVAVLSDITRSILAKDSHGSPVLWAKGIFSHA